MELHYSVPFKMTRSFRTRASGERQKILLVLLCPDILLVYWEQNSVPLFPRSWVTVKKTTPMMSQYLRIKSEHPDAILFFRMGDFYEMFFEDAKIASRELEIALTSRDKGQEDSVPLCGVPWHSSQPYISRLVRKGYKVAICEQVEDPKGAKGLVKREVVRVLSPGLIDDPETLEAKENNFLMGLAQGSNGFGLGFLDLSTGEFKICQVANFDTMLEEAIRNEPKEILISEGFRSTRWHNRLRDAFKPALFNYLPDSGYDFEHARTAIKSHLGEEGTANLFGNDIPSAISAAGAILSYVTENQRMNLEHIRSMHPYRVGDYMILDEATKRNLELARTVMGGQKKGSLLGLLDETLTPMGGRRLRGLQSPEHRRASGCCSRSPPRRIHPPGELSLRAAVRVRRPCRPTR